MKKGRRGEERDAGKIRRENDDDDDDDATG